MTNLRGYAEIKGRNIKILNEGTGCRIGKKQRDFKKTSQAVSTGLGGCGDGNCKRGLHGVTRGVDNG